MKNKIKLLLVSATTVLGLIGVGALSLNSVDNTYKLTSDLNTRDSFRVNKAAQNESTIEFENGTGSEYLSNVRVQYAPGAEENTGSMRLVAAVKGTVTSSSNVELPGTYGFHVSYAKGEELVDVMYDVEYVYHSISETVNDVTTYYTNDFSSFASHEGRKSVNEWANDANADYNLFIALKIENIPLTDFSKIVTVHLLDMLQLIMQKMLLKVIMLETIVIYIQCL